MLLRLLLGERESREEGRGKGEAPRAPLPARLSLPLSMPLPVAKPLPVPLPPSAPIPPQRPPKRER